MALNKIKVFTSYSGDVELVTDPLTGEINAERKSLSLFWKEVVVDADGSMYETGNRGAETIVLADHPALQASLEAVVGPAIATALAQIKANSVLPTEV